MGLKSISSELQIYRKRPRFDVERERLYSMYDFSRNNTILNKSESTTDMTRNTLTFLIAAVLVLVGFTSYGVNEARATDKDEIELVTVCVGEQCGYVNNKGQWHIPPKFRAADPFSKNGLAWVITLDGVTDGQTYTGKTFKGDSGKETPQNPYGGRFGLIDSTGAYVQYFQQLKPFSANGLAAAKVNDIWGFIDTSGQWVIEPSFNDVGDFSDYGPAPAKINGQWGYINTNGEWIIKPQFHLASSFGNDGLAMIFTSDQSGKINGYGDINIFGQRAEKPKSASGLIRAGKDGRWGFINVQGQWVVEPQFDDVQPIAGHDLAAAKINGQWGYIDIQGRWVITPQFDDVKSFADNGLAPAAISRKWGYVNISGKWAIEPKFDYAGEFGYREHKDVAQARIDRNLSFINTKGEWTAGPENMEPFAANGLAVARQNGKYGCVNASGQWIIKPIFDYIYSFGDRKSTKASLNGGSGYINDKGEWVHGPKFYWNYVRGSIDYRSGVHRTGLDENDAEQGSFMWQMVNGARILFNSQRDIILTIERIDGAEVIKNKAQEIIWPQKNAPEQTIK